MTKTRLLGGIGAAVGMLLLILDGKTALSGAQEGIELCIRTVIPSLFPFFALSALLTGTFMGTNIPFLRPVGTLCGIPKGAESILLTGFLGGYPVGAQSIHGAWKLGQLSKDQAERMLAFCNNAGPSFLFGMIAPMFPSTKYAWMLWGIHILSAIFVAVLLPKNDEDSIILGKESNISLSDALQKAVRVMALVCGWIVLFRVLIAFLNYWFLWYFPAELQVMLMGALELSNGCCSLLMIGNVGLRMIICSAILTLGGLCVTMQTVSVTRGLSLRLYFPAKLLQTVSSVLLTFAVQLLLPLEQRCHISPTFSIICVCVAAFFAVSLRKMQNNSSIPRPIGV